MPIVNDLGFIHYVEFASAKSDRETHENPTTLLLLHGTGGNETDLLEMGKQIAPEAAIISPRGKSLDEGVPRYFRRLAEGLFDIEDLKFRANELADFVRAAMRKYNLDPTRVVAVGYSNGANIAAGLLLLRPETLAGAVLFRAMIPLVPENLPDLSEKPIFMAAGESDPIVPKEQAEGLATLLEKCGALVTLHWRTGGAHALTKEEIVLAREWFATNFISFG